MGMEVVYVDPPKGQGLYLPLARPRPHLTVRGC